MLDAFDVDYEPKDMARLRGDFEHNDRLRETARKLDEVERERRKHAPPDPKPVAPVEGTWRDPTLYLPATLPDGWSLRAIDDNGAQIVELGDELVVHVGAARRDGRRWVSAMFVREGESGRAPSDAEVRSVLGVLRDCGRFQEMQLCLDGEPLAAPREIRVFSAPMKKKG